MTSTRTSIIVLINLMGKSFVLIEMDLSSKILSLILRVLIIRLGKSWKMPTKTLFLWLQESVNRSKEKCFFRNGNQLLWFLENVLPAVVLTLQNKSFQGKAPGKMIKVFSKTVVLELKVR